MVNVALTALSGKAKEVNAIEGFIMKVITQVIADNALKECGMVALRGIVLVKAETVISSWNFLISNTSIFS